VIGGRLHRFSIRIKKKLSSLMEPFNIAISEKKGFKVEPIFPCFPKLCNRSLLNPHPLQRRRWILPPKAPGPSSDHRWRAIRSGSAEHADSAPIAQKQGKRIDAKQNKTELYFLD
jgi:hypothetical protein